MGWLRRVKAVNEAVADRSTDHLKPLDFVAYVNKANASSASPIPSLCGHIPTMYICFSPASNHSDSCGMTTIQKKAARMAPSLFPERDLTSQ